MKYSFHWSGMKGLLVGEGSSRLGKCGKPLPLDEDI